MDEQISPTPDPAITNSPVTEAQTIETPPVAVEPVPAQELQKVATSPEPIPETTTAQMVGSEPLPASISEPAMSAGATAEAQQPENPTATQGSTVSPEPMPTPVSAPASMPAQAPVMETQRSIARRLLEKAQAVIQFRKQKKLEKIMALFVKKSHITNDEVEKLLHVSDATATRYLSHLERGGRIKQTGKTGKGVSYTKV